MTVVAFSTSQPLQDHRIGDSVVVGCGWLICRYLKLDSKDNTIQNMMKWKSQHENDGLGKYGGTRDLVGFGEKPPSPKWPNNAKVAINFVINFEEGGEKCILHGDTSSENLLSDIVGAESYEGERNLNMESLYDYGSRAGFWRLHRLFTSRKVPCTVFAVGMALERNPAVCRVLKETSDWEVASHGYRWIDYHNVDETTERDHIWRTIQIHEKLLGKRPVGFYQGKPNMNTRSLVVEEGGFKYDSDSYADDLPYWTLEYGDQPHLIIPYTLSENDMRFTSPNNFSTGSEFCQYLKETLKYLIEEGKSGSPKMMTVGLHCRLARPGRVAGIAEFVDFVKSYSKKDVWICTREQIADFWLENHYPRGAGSPVKPPVVVSDAAESSTTTTTADGEQPSTTETETSPGEETAPSTTEPDAAGEVVATTTEGA